MNTSEAWISFDCYGALVDWRTDMRGALEPVFGDKADAVLEAYYELELDVEQGSYRPYREVLAEALRRAAGAVGIPLPAEHRDVLAEAWPELPFFDDVASALRALRGQGLRLAVLTNCDDDLWRTTESRFPVALDDVVTAEFVRRYKPNPAHFLELRRRQEPPSGTWIHAACSWVHDIAPASALGLRTVWIDRDRTGHDPTRATAVLPDAAALPETLARLLAE